MAPPVPLPPAEGLASVATTVPPALPPGRAWVARPMCRITSVTLDRDDRVAAATAVASGACLDFILSVVPGAIAAGDSPATLTMARADILRLRKAAGQAGEASPRLAASRRVRDALYGLTEGGDD
jgi:hypothetical protein